MKLIEKHIDELKRLCNKYYVSELYVFGSVVNDKFTDKSDIDFLVKFKGVNPYDYFDNYLDFKDALTKLFSKEIDLVEAQTIKNPILKKSIDRNKIKLYGREDSKVAI
jgi:predicted nucleotidyltransferase